VQLGVSTARRRLTGIAVIVAVVATAVLGGLSSSWFSASMSLSPQ
jgi:hypothetical protein